MEQNSLPYRWVLACIIGEICAIIALIPNMMVAGYEGFLDHHIIQVKYLIMGGLIEGAFLGYFQGKVINRYFAINIMPWIMCTMIAGVIGWLLLLGSPVLRVYDNVTLRNSLEMVSELSGYQITSIGLLAGLTVGLVQGFLLFDYSNHFIWAAGNAIGWAIGAQSLHFAKTSFLLHQDSAMIYVIMFITAIFAATIGGYITAFILNFIRKRSVLCLSPQTTISA